ncbi:MAG: hypothetical protein LBC88_00225 [Spirochaetaceae bacterium]|jgi:hypothetical protein|nr:hypothetical protein [Spirochaetaceae bacterium]
MPNPRTALASAFLTAALCFPLFAQTEGEIPAEPDWIVENINSYARGSMVFTMSLGVTFPVLFLDNQFKPYHGHAESVFPGNINVGGTGFLSISYFLSPHWFLGGTLQGMFASTIRETMLFMIPLGIQGGYQFVAGPVEFPLYLMFGISPKSHGDAGNLSLFIKAGAAAFLRFHSNWSIGINAAWWFVPEWPKEGADKNRYGNLVETTLAVRYHF